MRALHETCIDLIHNRAVFGQFAQHERHHLRRFGLAQDKPDHPLEPLVQQRPRLVRAQVCRNRGLLQNGCQPLCELCATGLPQPILAAKVIGNRGNIGLGPRRDFPCRGGGESFAAKQGNARRDQCGAGAVGCVVCACLGHALQFQSND